MVKKKKRLSRIYTSKQIFRFLVLPVLLHLSNYFTFLTNSPNFLLWVTLSPCVWLPLFSLSTLF